MSSVARCFRRWSSASASGATKNRGAWSAGSRLRRHALSPEVGNPTTRKALYTERRALLKKIQAKPADSASMQERLIGIRKEMKAVQTVLRFTEPKSARSRRTVSIPNILVTRLKEHRKAQLQERLIAGKDWKESGLVFTTTIGTPLHARNVSREFKAMLKSADLPAIRFHDLRHTAATLLLAQGVDPRTIMETLGHSQISLTLNTYSHVLPKLQAAAAAKMDAALGG